MKFIDSLSDRVSAVADRAMTSPREVYFLGAYHEEIEEINEHQLA